MTYFWNTVQIVGGILSPFILWRLVVMFGSFVSLWASCAEEAAQKKTLAAKLSGRWVLEKIEQPPNPKMSTITIRNCDTQDLLSFSEYKEKIREAA